MSVEEKDSAGHAALLDLFHFVWNEMGLYESPDPRYSYVTSEDQIRLGELCEVVERAGITAEVTDRKEARWTPGATGTVSGRPRQGRAVRTTGGCAS